VRSVIKATRSDRHTVTEELVTVTWIAWRRPVSDATRSNRNNVHAGRVRSVTGLFFTSGCVVFLSQQLAARKSKIKRTHSRLLRCVTQQTGRSNTSIQHGHPSHLCPPRSKPTIITPSVWWYYSVPVCLSVWDTWVSEWSVGSTWWDSGGLCPTNDTPERRSSSETTVGNKEKWCWKANSCCIEGHHGGGEGEPFFAHCFFYFLLSAREQRWDHRVISVYYSSRNVQVQSDLYTFEGSGLIKDTLIKIGFWIVYCLAISFCSWSMEEWQLNDYCSQREGAEAFCWMLRGVKWSWPYAGNKSIWWTCTAPRTLTVGNISELYAPRPTRFTPGEKTSATRRIEGSWVWPWDDLGVLEKLWPLPGFKPRSLERPAHCPISTPTVLGPASIACGIAFIGSCICNLLFVHFTYIFKYS